MIEPFAFALGSLPRHIQTGASSFKRVAKSSVQVAPSSAESSSSYPYSGPRPHPLKAHFFTPSPRPSRINTIPINLTVSYTSSDLKGKARAVEHPEILDVSNILDWQAWAFPQSMPSLWSHNGAMRTALLKELSYAPKQSRRVRRGSRSNRSPSLNLSSVSSRRRQHRHSNFSTTSSLASSSSQAQLKIPPAEIQTPSIYIPSAYRSEDVKDMLAVYRFSQYLQNQASSKEDLQNLSDAFIEAKELKEFAMLTEEELLTLAESLASQIDGLCADQVFPQIVATWGAGLQEICTFLKIDHARNMGKEVVAESGVSTEKVAEAKYGDELSTSMNTENMIEGGDPNEPKPETGVENNLAGLTELDNASEVLDKSESNPTSSANVVNFCDRRASLLSRSLSFMGKFDEAQSYLRQKSPVEAKRLGMRSVFANALRSFLFSTACHNGLHSSLEFLWLRNKWYTPQNITCHALFQRLVATTPNLDEVYRLHDFWEKPTFRDMAQEIAYSCIRCKDFRKSEQIINELRKKRLEVVPQLITTTCRGLASEANDPTAAQAMLETMDDKDSEFYIKTKLYIAGRAGNVEVANDMLKLRSSQGTLTDSDISNVLYAFAVTGRTDDLQPVFDECFPVTGEIRIRRPNIFHYSIVVFAYAMRRDIKGITLWLEDMRKAGVSPNSTFFTTVILAFKKRGDINGAIDTFHHMREAGVKADIYTYTVLISFLANKKDCDSADALYIQAIEDGIIPDERLTNTLMNAHVESSSWREAARIFTHLTSLPSERQPPIVTYNCLMKAYVHIGAPFRLVGKMFFKLYEIGIQPDTYTFAALIQSATDAGQLNTANSIYKELKKRQEETGEKNIISQHILTILMSAYLQRGATWKAKKLLNEMIKEGLRPTSSTYEAIVKAYGKGSWEESMTIAEEFVNKLLDSPSEVRHWDLSPPKTKLPPANLYGPMLYNYALSGNVAEAERIYTTFLNRGGSPSITILRPLLIAYCKSSNISQASIVWNTIWELAQGATINEGESSKEIRTKVSDIHYPLSVYIDLLSKHGLHSEVTAIWSRLQEMSFEFNAHNWNYLAVVLIRAGEVERAFEVLESVLLPYESKARMNFNTPRPTEDMSVEEKLRYYDAIEPVPFQTNWRTTTAKATKKALAKRKDLDDELAIDADFSFPLKVLQIIAPTWNNWRPHYVVLRSFLIVLTQLRRGFIIRPTFPGEMRGDDVFTTFEEQDFDRAEAILDMLYRRYTATIARIEFFQTLEKRRLSSDEYNSIYIRR